MLNAEGANGSLAADAIRIVRAVATGEVAYLHADHLGQPQKLTDASASLLWDRVALPYGATHSEAGLGIRLQNCTELAAAGNRLHATGRVTEQGAVGYHPVRLRFLCPVQCVNLLLAQHGAGK